MDEDNSTQERPEHPVETWDDECRRWIEAAYRYEVATHHRPLR